MLYFLNLHCAVMSITSRWNWKGDKKRMIDFSILWDYFLAGFEFDFFFFFQSWKEEEFICQLLSCLSQIQPMGHYLPHICGSWGGLPQKMGPQEKPGGWTCEPGCGHKRRCSWIVAAELLPCIKLPDMLCPQLCPTLYDPVDCRTPGLLVHHQLPEFSQTHVHWVSDAIQPFHPLLSPSPPTFSLSQHQDLPQWVSSSHQVAKILELQLQHQSFQWVFRTDCL